MSGLKVKPVTRYLFKGKEYKTLQQVRDELRDVIGVEVIDKINRVCPPERHSDLFKLLEVLCSPEVRRTLIECYGVTMDIESDEFGTNGQCDTINVLDVKDGHSY